MFRDLKTFLEVFPMVQHDLNKRNAGSLRRYILVEWIIDNSRMVHIDAHARDSIVIVLSNSFSSFLEGRIDIFKSVLTIVVPGGGDMVKIFYWELDAKGKFIRTLWSGLLALIFMYWAVSIPSDVPIMNTVFAKVWVPVIVTLIYLADLVYRYRKWKKEEKSKTA